MLKAAYANSSAAIQLIIVVGLLLLGLLLFTIATFILGLIYSGSLQGVQEVLSNPVDNLSFLKSLQITQHILIFLFPPLMAAWFFSNRTMTYLYLQKYPRLRDMALVTLLVLVSLPLVNYTTVLNEGMKLPDTLKSIETWMRLQEENAMKLMQALLTNNSSYGFTVNVLMIAILPALAEELLFRGVFQRVFTKVFSNAHAGVLVAAFLFSAIHFQFFGFVPRFLLGVLFGYLLLWSGNMWLPVLAHFVNNFTGLLYYQKYGMESTDNLADYIGSTPDTYPYLFASLLLSSFILYYFYRNKAGVIS